MVRLFKDKKFVDDLATQLGAAFDWESTTQGYSYWDGVYRNLISIAREAKNDCRSQIEKLERDLAELKKKCCP